MRGLAMPISVRAFFAVSVGLALWWIYWSFFYFVLPSPEYAATLARLPQPFRDITVQAESRNALIATGAHVTLLLTLSSFAAFARQNWARWALVLYLVALQAMPIGYAAYLYFEMPRVFHTLYQSVDGWWLLYLARSWSRWPAYASLAIKLLMITLIFSPNARPWFRKGAPSVPLRGTPPP
jgi:hypothetical protein